MKIVFQVVHQTTPHASARHAGMHKHDYGTGSGLERLAFWKAMARAEFGFTRSALIVAHVLLVDYFNGRTGRCDPSGPTLARETSLTGRSVKRAIAELKRSGWWSVAREGTPGIGGRPNSYQPRFEMTTESGDTHDTSLAIESGDTHDTSFAIESGDTGDTPFPYSDIESGDTQGQKSYGRKLVTG